SAGGTATVEADGTTTSAVEGDRQVGRVELVPQLGLDVPADADLLANPLGDLDHDLGAVDQELLGVLPPLPELLALVGVPGTGLLHEAEVHADVERGALPADALAVHDVELGLPEWRGDLVL